MDIQVRSGDNLQAAINAANPGDTLFLEAGASFIGRFTLPPKAAGASVIIRSAAALPTRRITPADTALLPKILSSGSNGAALATQAGANNYQLLGLEFSLASPTVVVDTLVKLGDGSNLQNDLSLVPTNLLMDRCYVHGLPGIALKRGIGLNSASTIISGCYISECKITGQDSQAICGWNGPGPFLIEDNYIEGAGENLMFGGSDPFIANLIPSDITIRKNNFYKPLSWYPKDPSYGGIHWLVKNLLELKNSQRVLIEDNTFENSWADGQLGFCFSLKASHQSGRAPWTACADVTVRNNVIRHCGTGVNIQGNDGINPSTQVLRMVIENNLWEDISSNWGGTGFFVQMADADDVKILHNTSHQSGSILVLHQKPVTHFSFTQNIVPHNTYGVKGDGQATGNNSLNTYCPGCVFTDNIIIGPASWAKSYPAGNTFVADWASIDPATDAGYHLPLPPPPPVPTQFNLSVSHAETDTILSGTATDDNGTVLVDFTGNQAFHFPSCLDTLTDAQKDSLYADTYLPLIKTLLGIPL